ncbi:testis development-related protein isoform X4 [Numida meleagris]|uniref:testis development-related protein isoform X4 n=1 Tax=Numida meleagris TaxID=8996 RepID=UPI000B3E30CA|nr:testis development-related protein isoform X4 [Numida meleagris]
MMENECLGGDFYRLACLCENKTRTVGNTKCYIQRGPLGHQAELLGLRLLSRTHRPRVLRAAAFPGQQRLSCRGDAAAEQRKGRCGGGPAPPGREPRAAGAVRARTAPRTGCRGDGKARAPAPANMAAAARPAPAGIKTSFFTMKFHLQCLNLQQRFKVQVSGVGRK